MLCSPWYRGRPSGITPRTRARFLRKPGGAMFRGLSVAGSQLPRLSGGPTRVPRTHPRHRHRAMRLPHRIRASRRGCQTNRCARGAEPTSRRRRAPGRPRRADHGRMRAAGESPRGAMPPQRHRILRRPHRTRHSRSSSGTRRRRSNRGDHARGRHRRPPDRGRRGSRPVSSSSSRRAAGSRDSPSSTKPPGRAHIPAKGSFPRLMRSTSRAPASPRKTATSTVSAGRGNSYSGMVTRV
jgi:hypothetical protein